MVELSLFIAFIAGIVSFLSPCVLPIVPGFLAYLSGTSLDQSHVKRKDIFFNSFFFVLGFSIVFALLGVLLNSVLEVFAYDIQIWLSRIGGALIIFFGLYLVGLVSIPWFEREHKLKIRTHFKSRYITSLLFGFAFAVGWTPCVGAALGAILSLAAVHPGSAFNLLLVYSFGLGVPFLAMGLFASRATDLINRHAHVLGYVNKAFGAILIILGILVFTQSLNLIANFELLNRFILR